VQDHWLPGFNFEAEEGFAGDRYETLAISRLLALASAAFAVTIVEKPTGRFMIRSRTRVVLLHRRVAGEAETRRLGARCRQGHW